MNILILHESSLSISLSYPQSILPVGCAHFPTFFFPKPGTWRDEEYELSGEIIAINLDGCAQDPQLCHHRFRAPPSLASSPWTLSSDSQCFQPTPSQHRGGLPWTKKWRLAGLPNFWLYTHGDRYIKESRSFLQPTSLMMDNSLWLASKQIIGAWSKYGGPWYCWLWFLEDSWCLKSWNHRHAGIILLCVVLLNPFRTNGPLLWQKWFGKLPEEEHDRWNHRPWNANRTWMEQ